MLDVSAAEVLFSTCSPRPLAVGAVCRNKSPKNNTPHTDDGADLPRDMAMIILDEKIISGNSHLTGFYADHDSLPVLSPKTRFSVYRLHLARGIDRLLGDDAGPVPLFAVLPDTLRTRSRQTSFLPVRVVLPVVIATPPDLP